jgi:hypothetical protein
MLSESSRKASSLLCGYFMNKLGGHCPPSHHVGPASPSSLPPQLKRRFCRFHVSAFWLCLFKNIALFLLKLPLFSKKCPFSSKMLPFFAKNVAFFSKNAALFLQNIALFFKNFAFFNLPLQSGFTKIAIAILTFEMVTDLTLISPL